MRKELMNWLEQHAKKDKNIILLTGDLGFSFIEEFAAKYPDQYINCGTIEQSMVGMAAGLARAGKKPYVYSTIPFIIMRAYEQVRDDIAYQNLNVKLLGISMSGFIGFTHEISKNEDKKILEHLPNLQVKTPNNVYTLGVALDNSYFNKKPTYIRI